MSLVMAQCRCLAQMIMPSIKSSTFFVAHEDRTRFCYFGLQLLPCYMLDHAHKMFEHSASEKVQQSITKNKRTGRIKLTMGNVYL